MLLLLLAVGCADPEINTNAMWIRRQLDTASVGCKTDKRQWTMRCVDNRWSSARNVTCGPGRQTFAICQ